MRVRLRGLGSNDVFLISEEGRANILENIPMV